MHLFKASELDTLSDICFGRKTILDVGSKEEYDVYIELIKKIALRSIAISICKKKDQFERNSIKNRVIPELHNELDKLINEEWKKHVKQRL